jgi:hypothetical protein
MLGTVIVGRGIDPAASELRGLSSSHVAFRYGNDNDIVASTLPLFKEVEFEDRASRAGSSTGPTCRSAVVLIVEDEDAARELAAEFTKSAG